MCAGERGESCANSYSLCCRSLLMYIGLHMFNFHFRRWIGIRGWEEEKMRELIESDKSFLHEAVCVHSRLLKFAGFFGRTLSPL